MTSQAEIIDTHAHLAFGELDKDLENVIKRARECGVNRIINIASGSGIAKIARSLEIGSQHEGVYNSIGIHPSEVCDFTEDDARQVEALMKHPKTVAVGETGLDFYRDPSSAGLQETFFRRLIGIAKANNLPLIIHEREAFSRISSILGEEGVYGSIPFVFHCFTGTWKEAMAVIDSGGHISLTGIITFKNAHYLRETVSKVPIERIMIETDSPYLAPEPKRGRRNEPCFVKYVAEQIARIKKISYEETASITTQNAVRFFNLDR